MVVKVSVVLTYPTLFQGEEIHFAPNLKIKWISELKLRTEGR